MTEKTIEAIKTSLDLISIKEFGYSALVEAARAGDPSRVESLLDAGANPNDADADGWSPLRWAIERGQPAMVDRLLAADADANNADAAGWTVLVAAVFDGQQGMVESLLAAGADASAVDVLGWTALTTAVFKGFGGIVDSLLQAGANPFTVDVNGQTLLDLAAWKGHHGVTQSLHNAIAKLAPAHGSGPVIVANAPMDEAHIVLEHMEMPAWEAAAGFHEIDVSVSPSVSGTFTDTAAGLVGQHGCLEATTVY